MNVPGLQPFLFEETIYRGLHFAPVLAGMVPGLWPWTSAMKDEAVKSTKPISGSAAPQCGKGKDVYSCPLPYIAGLYGMGKNSYNPRSPAALGCGAPGNAFLRLHRDSAISGIVLLYRQTIEKGYTS